MSGYARADELYPGDVVRLYGCLWRVTKAEASGDSNTVNLGLGLLGSGSRQVTLPADRGVGTAEGDQQ